MLSKSVLGGLALIVATSVLAAAPAEAAPPKLTIGTIASKTAPYGKTVKIVPRVSGSGNIKASSKRLTVTRNGKVVTSNATSANLKAGTYRVSTTVKYKTWTHVKKAVVVAKRGSALWEKDLQDPGAPYLTTCRVTSVSSSDYMARCTVGASTTKSITVSSDKIAYGGLYGTEVGEVFTPLYVRTPVDLKANRTVRKYSATKSKSKKQSLVIKQGKKPRGCALKSEFDRVQYGHSRATVTRVMQTAGTQAYYSGGIELREYKACDADQYMSVTFEDGYVYDKTFADFGY